MKQEGVQDLQKLKIILKYTLQSQRGNLQIHTSSERVEHV